MLSNFNEKSKKDYDYIIDCLKVKDLSKDRYQSPINPLRVDRIVRNFDKKQLQPIDVSLRNGKYYIVDGQHRVAALEIKGIPDVTAKVHFDLTYPQEAMLYYQLNNPQNRRTPTTIHRKNALVEAGDKNTIEIKNIVESCGFIYGSDQSKAINKIVCVAKLDKIQKDLGLSGLYRVLRLIQGTWYNNYDAMDQGIIMGVYLFVKYYENAFDDSKFVKKMSHVSPREILNNANAVKRYSSNSYTQYGKEILLQYNKNRSQKLPNKFEE
jgi:hypothetical protein